MVGKCSDSNHRTWKSDVQRIGEGRQGCGGKASQCVSVAEPTLQHLRGDLEEKHVMFIFLILHL